MEQATVSELAPWPDDREASFAQCLRRVRRRLAGKQAWLSSELGCTDAAISLWESGDRLPNIRNLQRLLTTVARSGATTAELLGLRAAWHRGKVAPEYRAAAAAAKRPKGPK
jgi:DNA-binding transcriptional regulator YiaG